jgi:hypothetical protein
MGLNDGQQTTIVDRLSVFREKGETLYDCTFA